MAITKVSNSVLNLSGNTDALGLPKGTDAQRPTPVAGMLRFNTTTGEFEGYNGTEWGKMVDGSGTANYIPKWTDGDTIGNSIIYDDGTSVGIGTSSPTSVATRTTLNLSGSTGSAIRLSDNISNAFLDYTDGAGSRFSVNAAEPIILLTNSAERMRITSEGLVEVKGVANGNCFEVGGGFADRGLMISTGVSSGAGSGLVIYNAQISDNKGAHIFESSGRTAFTIANTLVCSGDLNDTSDVSKKTNINDLIGGLDVVLQLRPVSYQWKEEEGRGSEIRNGFIAQEVESVIPEIVLGEEGDKSLNVTGVVAHLTKAIQELKAEIEILKTK